MTLLYSYDPDTVENIALGLLRKYGIAREDPIFNKADESRNDRLHMRGAAPGQDNVSPFDVHLQIAARTPDEPHMTLHRGNTPSLRLPLIRPAPFETELSAVCAKPCCSSFISLSVDCPSMGTQAPCDDTVWSLLEQLHNHHNLYHSHAPEIQNIMTTLPDKT